MEEDIKDEVAEALNLADITKALQVPPASGDRRTNRGPRVGLRNALENDVELDLRIVSDQEIHDSDSAYLARISYVSSYLRIWDFLRQPAKTFAQRLAMAKIAQSNINNAESTRLHVLQLGRNSVADDELRKQIKTLRASVRSLSERRAVILHDEKTTEEKELQRAEASAVNSS